MALYPCSSGLSRNYLVRVGSLLPDNVITLDVRRGGEWGAVCTDTSWTDSEALVACRQLYNQYVSSYIGGASVL